MASHQIKDTSIMHYIGNDGNGERYAVGYITPCRNDFIDVYDYFYKKNPTYNFNFGDMNQEDIKKRSKIYSIYLSQTEKFLQLIFQNGKLNNNIFNCSLEDEKIKIYTSSNNDDKYPFGTIVSENGYIYNSDIILYLAIFHTFNYKQMLTCMYDSISKDKTFPQEMEKDNTPWYIQQKNPISPIVIKYNFENIINLIKNENKNYNPCIIQYKNRDGIGIGYVLSYKNNVGDLVRIYYTFYHRHDSPFLNLVPIYPEPPYILFNIENINDKTKRIIFLNSEIEVNENIKKINNDTLLTTCPLGLENLPEADTNPLKNLPITICWNKNKIDIYYLKRLKYKFKDNDLKFILNTNDILSYEQLINNETYIDQSVINIDSDNGIVLPNQKIPGSDRERKIILSPIIHSGTINWLFSKEKLGKTWLALSIAYACGKGDRPVGKWTSINRCRVLYIDGEMPGDEIQKHCDMIMRGFGDPFGYKNRPFAVYSFYEEGYDYDSILDEEWLSKYKLNLFSYDLLILDNYYSLNENRIDIKPFIKLLREISRKGTAIIVVDHTNDDDDLQGSINKKRVSDLGIKLTRNVDEGRINIDYQFDRYCKGNQTQNTIQYIFIDDSFKIVSTDKIESNISSEATRLSDKDLRMLMSYIGFTIHKYTLAELENLIKRNKSTISGYIKSVKEQRNGNSVSRDRISNIQFFKEKLAEFSTKDKNWFEQKVLELDDIQ